MEVLMSGGRVTRIGNEVIISDFFVRTSESLTHEMFDLRGAEIVHAMLKSLGIKTQPEDHFSITGCNFQYDPSPFYQLEND